MVCLCFEFNQSALVFVINFDVQKINRSCKIAVIQGGILLLLAWVFWLYKGLKWYKVHHCAEDKGMGYVPVYSPVLQTSASSCVGN